MSDKPIGKGDLVMVIRWPCCGHNLGKIGVVENIDHIRQTYCRQCGRKSLGIPNADFAPHGIGSLKCCPIAWLKRIDPPALSEGMPEKEELTA